MPDQNYNTGDGLTPVKESGASSTKEVTSPDWVTVGANHEVVIDGLKSWIKIELGSSVQEGESSAEAIKRVSKTVASSMVNEIERQAGVIVDANGKQQKS